MCNPRINLAQIYFEIYNTNNEIRGNILEMFREDNYYVETTRLNTDGSLHVEPTEHEMFDCEFCAWNEFGSSLNSLFNYFYTWSSLIKGEETCTIKFLFYDNNGNIHGKVLKFSESDQIYYVEIIPLLEDGSLHMESDFVNDFMNVENAWKRFYVELQQIVNNIEIWTPSKTQIHT